MNRRDFVKTLVGLGVSLALPEVDIPEPESEPGQDDSIRGLAAHEGGIVCCNACEIWATDDLGITWIEVGRPPTDAEICTIMIASDGTWYAGMSDGQLWKSDTEGLTWEIFSNIHEP